jgi:phage-related protein
MYGPLIDVLQSAMKQLTKFSSKEQRSFQKALDRFTTADPLTRRTMLKHIGNSHFDNLQVKWSIRASRKHRILLDWEQDHYVVRAFVSRADRKYYWNES